MRTRNAFRSALALGAGFLFGAALFLWLRGPSPDQERAEDVLDLDLDDELAELQEGEGLALAVD